MTGQQGQVSILKNVRIQAAPSASASCHPCPGTLHPCTLAHIPSSTWASCHPCPATLHSTSLLCPNARHDDMSRRVPPLPNERRWYVQSRGVCHPCPITLHLFGVSASSLVCLHLFGVSTLHLFGVSTAHGLGHVEGVNRRGPLWCGPFECCPLNRSNWCLARSQNKRRRTRRKTRWRTRLSIWSSALTRASADLVLQPAHTCFADHRLHAHLLTLFFSLLSRASCPHHLFLNP